MMLLFLQTHTEHTVFSILQNLGEIGREKEREKRSETRVYIFVFRFVAAHKKILEKKCCNEKIVGRASNPRVE